MTRDKLPGQDLSRRIFLKKMRWAPALFLPAPICKAAFRPPLGRTASTREASFDLADYHVSPHYPAKSPLDDVLSKLQPGADEYVTEKYAFEIARALGEWSRALQAEPPALGTLANFLDSALAAGSLVPVSQNTLRSDELFDISRRRFGGDAAPGRERFLDQMKAYLSGMARIETAEFEITGIEEIADKPGTLSVEIRYDLVGTTAQVGHEQRVGYWKTQWTKDEANGWRAVHWEGTEETLSRARGRLFADVTFAALGQTESYKKQMLHGVDYWRTVLDSACGIDVYGNNGVAAGDFDNDGFDDLYVCQPAGLPNRLYHNRGDGTFEDVTEKAGVGVLDGTACALFADFDNRGLQDLLVVGGSGPLLFVNQGNGKFQWKRDEFQFAQPPQGTFTHAAAADYDGDGRLDIYFCLYSYYVGLEQYHYPAPYFDARNGPPNFLLHNDGNFKFRDDTERAGLNADNNRYSFACAWGDFKANVMPDLYVANDFGRSNLYQNDGGGKFTAVSTEARVEDVGAGMSATWLDYDGDGKQDVYVSNMWSAAGLRVSEQKLFHAKEPESIRALYRRHAGGNSLYRNLGDGKFENVSHAAGVDVGRWAWASDTWDFDHDGFSDLYVANGYISGPRNSKRNAADVASFFWRQVVANSPETATPEQRYELGWNAINELIRTDASWNGYERNVLYVNNHDGTFSDVSGVAGMDFPDDSRSFALADLDHDGRLEVVLKNRNAPQLRVLRNAAKTLGNSIAFRLRGTKSNRDAIGAAVTVDAEGRKQTKYLQAGSGFLSQHTKELFFGVGKTQGDIRASIRWPSGLTQKFEHLPVNHRVEIEEGSETFSAKAFTEAPKSYAHAGEPAKPEALPVSAETWLIEPLSAPEFSLPDLSGKTHELSSLRGSFALLNFWEAAAPACIEQLRSLEKQHSSLASNGLRILAINLDDTNNQEKARALPITRSLPFPVLLGNEETAGIYNIVYRYLFDRRRDLPLPSSLLVNGDGKIVKVYQGPLNPSVLEADLKSVPTTAAERVHRALPFEGTLFQDEFQRNDFTFGVAMFQRGYLDQAAAAFQQVIAAKPQDSEAYYNLGTLYLRKNSLPEARRYLEQTLKLDPGYAEAWNNLGMIAGQEGQAEEAIHDFQQCLQLRPTYVIALLNLGNLYRRQGAMEDAEKLLGQALQLEPDNAEANYSLGMLYARQQQLERAADFLQKAVSLKPDYPDALNNLGVLFVREERYPEAKQQFETCIRVAPNFDQAYLNLARLYVLLNDKEKAREILQALLRQQPQHKLAQQALEMLN
ncbi:MAG: FG-GAP-like repeat-containing protein [Candidatus Acidiferrum sp.]